MDAYDHEERRESYMHKTRGLKEHEGDNLQEKMEELNKTKEELKRAKDNATQSWLDSRPMIDRLEKLQSDLASARNQTSMSNVVILELESQLEETNKDIKAKVEEELKTTKITHEITQELDQIRQELETIKKETEESKDRSRRLKQVLRMRRQTLRTLQLTLRAIRIESEAFKASEGEVQRLINLSLVDNSDVRLTQEEYQALRKKAKEEISLAEWRISVSMEQKLAAEENRNLASSKLKDMKSTHRSSRRKAEDVNTIKQQEEQNRRIRREVDQVNRGSDFPKARAKAIANSNRRKPRKMKMRSSASNGNKKEVKKTKLSILRYITTLCQCLSK